jgi:osmotically-inducible protein OsmY
MKTDSRIQAEVIAKLKWDTAIEPSAIGVEVKEGIVTLTGQVRSFAAKYAAERAALGVIGIKALVIELEVELYGQHTHPDAALARAVELALESVHGPATAPVKIMVEHGCVTLSGEVDSDSLRSAIVEAVSHVEGIAGVSEKIMIKPPRSLAAAKAESVAALERRGGVDTDDVAVQLL